MRTISPPRHHRRVHMGSGLIVGALALALLPSAVAANATTLQGASQPSSVAAEQATAMQLRVIHTRFGTALHRQSSESLAQSVNRQREKFGNLGAIRLFHPGLPDRWSEINAAVGNTPVSISFKASPNKVLSGELDSFFKNWFATAPVDRRTFWTYYHEPEDNIQRGEFTAEQYRLAWGHLADIADEAYPGRKLRATLVLMCWTLDQHSGRDWRDYYPAGRISIMGWDCYSASNDSYRDPASLLDAAIAVSNSVGRPWGIAELGSKLATRDDGSGRAAWLGAVSAYASRNGARFVTYFDSNVGGEFRLLDQPSVRAWSAESTSWPRSTN